MARKKYTYDMFIKHRVRIIEKIRDGETPQRILYALKKAGWYMDTKTKESILRTRKINEL